MIDYDRLFKELLTTFFVEFLELFLPEVAAYCEPGEPEFLNQEVFSDVTSGDRREVGVLAKLRFKGEDAAFLVHVEDQNQPEADFNKRMFRYFARLSETHDLPVYPVALFTFDAPVRPEPDRYQVVFPDRAVLDFSFAVIQLNRLNWRDYVSRSNPVASALMAKMSIAEADRPRVKLECLRLLATLKLNPAKMQLISGFVDTYLRLNQAEQKVFQDEAAVLLPEEKKTVFKMTTSWKEEGILEGMEQGMQQGMKQEIEKMVLRQLRRRFGSVEEAVEARIRSMTTAQLEDLAEALLDFQTPDAILPYLESQTQTEAQTQTPPADALAGNGAA